MIADLRKLEQQWRALAAEKATKARTDVSSKYADELLAEAAAFCECADELIRVLDKHAPVVVTLPGYLERKADEAKRMREELASVDTSEPAK